MGTSTGLGDHSITLTTFGLWVAIWTKGSSYSVLVTNYGVPIASDLAEKVAGRM